MVSMGPAHDASQIRVTRIDMHIGYAHAKQVYKTVLLSNLQALLSMVLLQGAAGY